MVSSQGSLWWMDSNPSQRSPGSSRSKRKGTLWLTDQDRCVDNLLSKVASDLGDPIVRVSGERIESPEYLVSVIERHLRDYAVGEVVILGHSYFIPFEKGANKLGETEYVGEHDCLLRRVAKRQQSSKLAEQRLLKVNVELSQFCSLYKIQAIAELQMTPLFFRVESNALCWYDEYAMEFQAIGNESIFPH